MNVSVTINSASLAQAHRNLNEVVDKLQRTAVREAVQKAALPILKEARARVPRRYGHLRKSLVRKIRTYRDNAMVMAVVGPNRAYRSGDGRERIRPVKYAHLVEFGTSTAAPHPFMRPAFESRSREATRVYAREISTAIKRVGARYNRRSRI